MPGPVTTPGANTQSSATPVLASNALPIGTRINEFEITRVVGEGGFSIVYLAFDHTLHRSIALKEYIPSQLASRRGDQTVAVRSAQHQQTFEAGLRSFINEARLLAQFDHPALVKVYRFWEANGTAYMAMPYYEGRTLKDILREHPEQANEAWLKRLLLPLLDALTLLHDHRCYHRDIAPDNIQILDNEQPVLLDFGAARRTIGDMTQAFTVILKPGYAPIEQYAEETDFKQGPWTDLYALSAVLYWAIIGKPPPTAVARVIKDPLEPLAARRLRAFDPAFLSGIDRGLAVRPEARPQSVAAWRKMLAIDERAIARTGTRSPPAADETLPGLAAEPEAQLQQTPDVPARDRSSAGASMESDRTILVPGLHRTRQQSDNAAPGPAHATAESGGPVASVAATWQAPDDRARIAPASRRRLARSAVIAATAVIVAVVTWWLVARPFSEQEPAPVVAKAVDAGQSPPGPAVTAGSTQSPSPPPQSSMQAPATAQTRTPQTQTPPQSEQPPPVPAGPAAPGTLSGSQPNPPVAEDETQWAAIRNTDNIDDLRAFRRRFPQSPHAQDAAVRIQQLMRESRENAREAEPPGPPAGSAPPAVAKAAPATRPKAEPSVQGTGAAVTANTATSPAKSKGTVRIRVQPFGYVYIDGALIGPSPPSRDVQLAPGKHRIEARNEQENPSVIHKEIDVAGGASTEVPLHFGQ